MVESRSRRSRSRTPPQRSPQTRLDPHARRLLGVRPDHWRKGYFSTLLSPTSTASHFCIPIALREAVAHLYNHTYRQGKASQYTYENVCIVPGGRAGLSRVAAVIGDVYCVSRVRATGTAFLTRPSSPIKFPITLPTIKFSAHSNGLYQSLLRELNPWLSKQRY